MLDIKDIRVGNMLTHNQHGIITVEGIKPHAHGVSVYTKDSWVYLHNCERIKLSEEKLIELGFISKGYTCPEYGTKFTFPYEKKIDKYLIVSIEEDMSLEFKCEVGTSEDSIVPSKLVKYVHELQNLWYVLSGEELIK